MTMERERGNVKTIITPLFPKKIMQLIIYRSSLPYWGSFTFNSILLMGHSDLIFYLT
jgi:hypothetical protein